MSLVPWFIAAVAAIAAIAIWFTAGRVEAPPVPRTVTSIMSPTESGFDVRLGFAFSPDGNRVAFPARNADGVVQLWVRELDRAEARALGATSTVRWSRLTV